MINYSDPIALRNLWLQESGLTFCAAILLHMLSHPPRLLYFLSLLTTVYGLSRALISLSEISVASRHLYLIASRRYNHAMIWFHRWQRRRLLRRQEATRLSDGNGCAVTKNFHNQLQNVRKTSTAALMARKRFVSPRIAGPLLFASPLAHDCTTITPLQARVKKQCSTSTVSVTATDGDYSGLLRQAPLKNHMQNQLTHEHGGRALLYGILGKLWKAVLTVCSNKTARLGQIGMRFFGSGIANSAKQTLFPGGLRSGGGHVSFVNSIVQVKGMFCCCELKLLHSAIILHRCYVSHLVYLICAARSQVPGEPIRSVASATSNCSVSCEPSW